MCYHHSGVYYTYAMTNHSTINCLLVEDNPGDVELTRDSLSANKLLVNLHVVNDGEAALAYLHHALATQSVIPDLIILDLNLPRKSGKEVLAEVRQTVGLQTIPIVILTSSNAESDVARSYQLGANCYVTKPLSLEAFQIAVQSIEQFWFSIVRLPSRSNTP